MPMNKEPAGGRIRLTPRETLLLAMEMVLRAQRLRLLFGSFSVADFTRYRACSFYVTRDVLQHRLRTTMAPMYS